MRAAEIRDVLVAGLRAGHPDTAANRIWPEMAVCLGASRVDVCLINGSMTGYEIKSARDNVGRLSRQVEYYGRVLDNAAVVVAPNHLRHVLSVLPEWWGVLVVSDGEDVAFEQVRGMSPNPCQEAASLVQLLWRNEALHELQLRGLHNGLAKATRWVVWDRLVEHLEMTELRRVVRDRLKVRPAWTAT